FRSIDDRESGRIEDIPRNDYIGATEKDNGVAIGVCCRLVEDLNAFAIEVQVFSWLIERFCWPCSGRELRLRRWSAHAGQDLFDRKDRRAASQEIGTNAGSAALSEQRLTGFCDRSVASYMIGVGAAVDDVTDGLWRNFLDGRENGIRIRGRPGVDHDHSV